MIKRPFIFYIDSACYVYVDASLLPNLSHSLELRHPILEEKVWPYAPNFTQMVPNTYSQVIARRYSCRNDCVVRVLKLDFCRFHGDVDHPICAYISAVLYLKWIMTDRSVIKVPYYNFPDRTRMYQIGTFFYAIYFYVSFPMFFR